MGWRFLIENLVSGQSCRGIFYEFIQIEITLRDNGMQVGVITVTE